MLVCTCPQICGRVAFIAWTTAVISSACLLGRYIHDITYPVCLEDVVEGEEGNHSKHETQQRRLECGLEVKVRVCTGMHPTCQGRVILK